MSASTPSTGTIDGDMAAWVTSHGLFSKPPDMLTKRELHALVRTAERERRGGYSAPLPPPVERRRIRLAAGWTQREMADMLHVSRHAVSRFERKAGWLNGERLPGREPSGDLRDDYSQLLRQLMDEAEQ